MKTRYIVIPIIGIGIVFAFLCAGKNAYFTSFSTEITNTDTSSISDLLTEHSTIIESGESELDITTLYTRTQDKFNDTINRFNMEYKTQFAIATPNDLELSGQNAQQVYQDMLNMSQEEYWDTLRQAYEANEKFRLEDDEV